MKVRFRSFSFSLGRGVTHEDYLKHLLTCNEGDFHFADKDRIFHISDSVDADYYVGCLISLRDYKNSCTLKDQSVIVVRTTEENEALMDFNYFVIHKKSHRVLYQDYHQSLSLNQFGLFLKERHDGMVYERVNAALKAPEIKNDEERKKAIKKKVKEMGGFTLSAEVKSENFEQLAGQLERISSFEYSTYKVEAEEIGFAPLSGYARAASKKVSFKRDTPVSLAVKGVKRIFDRDSAHKGSVRGYDPEGVRQIIHITENPDYLAEHEYDDVTLKIQGKKISDLQGNWIVKELLATAQGNSLNIRLKTA